MLDNYSKVPFGENRKAGERPARDSPSAGPVTIGELDEVGGSDVHDRFYEGVEFGDLVGQVEAVS